MLHGVGRGVQPGIPHGDALLAGDVGPPQQGLDAPDQFLIVHGLGEIIVDAGGKALPLAVHGLQGGEEQHGDVVPLRPEGPHHLVAVHHRHHHIRHDEVHVLPLQNVQGLPAVGRRRHRELVAQLGLGQQADGLVVLRQ